jgi:hypothetical protein
MLTNRQISEYQDAYQGYSIRPKGSIIPWYEELTVQLIPGEGSALIAGRFSNSANNRADGQRIPC